MIRTTIFRKRTIAVLAVLWGLPTSFSIAGDHFGYHPATDRCSGCATGQCQVSPNFGYHAPSYRRWPGATIYEGYRSRKSGVSVPDQKIPSVLDEGRIEPRSRSNRPLDPQRPLPGQIIPGGAEGSSMRGNTVPQSGRPFDGMIPETELPSRRANNGPAGGAFEAPPAIQPGPTNSGDVFNLPTDEGAPTPPANDAPFDPFAPAADDAPLFDPAGAGEPDFGVIQPPTRNVNVRAVRAIRNRAAVLYPAANEASPSFSDRADGKTSTESAKSEADDAFDFSGLLPLSQDSPKLTPATEGPSDVATDTHKSDHVADAKATVMRDWVGRTVNPVSFDQPIQNNVAAPAISSGAAHAEPEPLPQLDTEPLPLEPDSMLQPKPVAASTPNDKPAVGPQETTQPDADEYITLPSSNPLRKGKRVLKGSFESTKTVLHEERHLPVDNEFAADDTQVSSSHVETVAWEADVVSEETIETKPLLPAAMNTSSAHARPTSDAEQMPQLELKTSTGSISPSPRSLAQSGRHSLRESLRKNPLR